MVLWIQYLLLWHVLEGHLPMLTHHLSDLLIGRVVHKVELV